MSSRCSRYHRRIHRKEALKQSYFLYGFTSITKHPSWACIFPSPQSRCTVKQSTHSSSKTPKQHSDQYAAQNGRQPPKSHPKLVHATFRTSEHPSVFTLLLRSTQLPTPTFMLSACPLYIFRAFKHFS